MGTRYDVVVVVGGTAGCIIASRLCERVSTVSCSWNRGPDYGSREVLPSALADVRYVPIQGHVPDPDPRHDWGLTVAAKDGTPIAVPQGRLIGGGFVINGSISLRAAAADYRQWPAPGCPNWNWKQVLRTFGAQLAAMLRTVVHGERDPDVDEVKARQWMGAATSRRSW